MANYHLKVSTLSPLHIGAGEELRLGFDFMVRGSSTCRLDVDRVLETHPGWQTARGGRYPLPGELLSEKDYDNPELFRYVLRGRPRSGKGDARLQACIKDPFDRPYLPGSSIKGALRTALAWTGWEEVKPRLDSSKLNRSRSWAGQRLERELFGENPNKDLLRALQVGDCFGPNKADDSLIIANAQVLTQSKGASGAPIELEAIRPNLAFEGSLRVDESLFTPQADRVLRFNDRKHWLDELIPRVRQHSLARIEKHQEWFAEVEGADGIANFYHQMSRAALGPNQALLQLGWGTGWDGKTFWTHLTADEHLFERIVSTYRLDKAGRQSRRQPGDPFPKSRRSVMALKKDPSGRAIDRPAAPFGWVLIEIKPE